MADELSERIPFMVESTDMPEAFPLPAATYAVFASTTTASFGWPRPRNDDPVMFVVSKVSPVSGRGRRVESFALDEAGWRQAWDYLTTTQPKLAVAVRDEFLKRREVPSSQAASPTQPTPSASNAGASGSPARTPATPPDGSAAWIAGLILIGLVLGLIGGIVAASQAPGTDFYGDPTGSHGGFIAGLVVASLGGVALWFGLIFGIVRLATSSIRTSLTRLERLVGELSNAVTHPPAKQPDSTRRSGSKN